VRWRQVVLLYAVLALLAGEYWLVERRRVEPPATHPVRERILPLQVEDLREVRLRRGGRTIVSRREGGVWAVVEPPNATIPQDLLEAFAVALTEAEEIARVGGAEVDPRAYGLDEGAARVEVVAAQGEPLLVTIGETNPTGTAVYARRGASPDVILIGRNVRYYEDLIFQALPAGRVPAADDGPVG
jgi:hypothetical protein